MKQCLNGTNQSHLLSKDIIWFNLAACKFRANQRKYFSSLCAGRLLHSLPERRSSELKAVGGFEASCCEAVEARVCERGYTRSGGGTGSVPGRLAATRAAPFLFSPLL